MVAFPAFCPHCGLVFEGRGFVVTGSTSVTMKGSRETCPRCGGVAEIPDGTFNVVGDTIEVLSAPELTFSRIQELEAIVERLRLGEADEAATLAAAPELAPLFERYQPMMRKALLAFLIFALQTLAAQALAEHRDHGASRADVERAVQGAVRMCMRPAP